MGVSYVSLYFDPQTTYSPETGAFLIPQEVTV